MVYSDGKAVFDMITVTPFPGKIRLLGSRCPTIKIMELQEIFQPEKRDACGNAAPVSCAGNIGNSGLSDMDTLNYGKRE